MKQISGSFLSFLGAVPQSALEPSLVRQTAKNSRSLRQKREAMPKLAKESRAKLEKN